MMRIFARSEKHNTEQRETKGRTVFPNSVDDNGFGDQSDSMHAKIYAFHRDQQQELRRQVSDDLQRAWKAIRRMETLSEACET